MTAFVARTNDRVSASAGSSVRRSMSRPSFSERFVAFQAARAERRLAADPFTRMIDGH